MSRTTSSRNELTPLRTRLVFLAVITCGLGSMAPTCSGDEKKAAPAEKEDEGEKSSGDASATASAALSAGVGASADVEAPSAVAAGKDDLFKSESAFVEQSEAGSVAFVIEPDGTTKVAVADVDGALKTDRSVALYVPNGEGGSTEVALALDSDRRYLVGKLPALSAEITPVNYEINGGVDPWKGILHLPAGGTKALNVSAKRAADAHAKPGVGPHGGRMERIGDDDVEILLDPDSGEARAWIIVEGRVVSPGERKISFYIDHHHVRFFPDQNDSFYALVSVDARASFRASRKLSIVLHHGPVFHTHLFGFRPRMRVFGARAVINVSVVGWTKEKKVKWDKNPNEPGLGWAKGKDKHDDKGPGGGNGSKGPGADHKSSGGGNGKGGGGDKGGGGHGKGGGGKGGKGKK